VDGRPNRRNKTAFSNFSGVVWTGNGLICARLCVLEKLVT